MRIPDRPSTCEVGFEQLAIIPHEKRCSCPDRGRSQLARAAEEYDEKVFVRGSIVGQIEVEHLAPFGHPKMCDAVERIERRFAEDRLLDGILNRAIDYPVPSKKLLRAFAALSPWAVIPPIESSGEWGHRVLLSGSVAK